jgi:hypothetical protein
MLLFRALSEKTHRFHGKLWTIEKPQVESSEQQDNANIQHQPLPESVSEERKIQTDYDGCHRQYVKRDAYLSAHFQYPSFTPPVGSCTGPRGLALVGSRQSFPSDWSLTIANRPTRPPITA